MQGASVEFRHWKEVVDDADNAIEAASDQETEEAVCELWLEDPRSFMEDVTINPSTRTAGSMVRRQATGGLGLQRFNDPRQKTAASTDWDQEFKDAQKHVASVLSNLGNGR